jgi:hypothetical protein
MQEDGIVSNSMTTRAAELFRQAAGQGRSALDAGELKALLDGLGLAFDAAAPAGAVDVRISLNSTREFGMVISAGLGGLEAELDEGNFRRDRASVYAAAALTDAEPIFSASSGAPWPTRSSPPWRSAPERQRPTRRLEACFARCWRWRKPSRPESRRVLRAAGAGAEPAAGGRGSPCAARSARSARRSPAAWPRPIARRSTS